jgi:hypothetical protein
MIDFVTSLMVSEVIEKGKLLVDAKSKIPSAPKIIPAQQNVNFLCLGLNLMIEFTSLSITKI